MKFFFRNIIVPLIVLLLPVMALAQVSIKAFADRDKILIGEPIKLTVEAYTPLGSTVQWFTADTIPGFEITNRSQLDTTGNVDGKKTTQVLTITGFDSGRLQIPPFQVIVNGQPYYSDSLQIDVAFISFDSKEDYRTIKEIVQPPEPQNNVPWIIAAIALLAIAGILYIFRKKKRAVELKPEAIHISAYDEAMKGLKNLEKKGAAVLGEKNYYSLMNDILRKYIATKYKIATFERTNDELIMQIRKINIPKDAFASLSQALRIADFVKFAKFRPLEEDNKNNLEIVRSSIKILDNSITRAV